MSDQLKQGDAGDHVAQLHQRLRVAGHTIALAEVETRHFGPTTHRALLDLQVQLGLQPTGEIDIATLLTIESGDGRDTTLIAEVIVSREDPPPSSRPSGSGGTPTPPAGGGTGGGSPPTPPGPDTAGAVHGALVDQDGAPVARTRIRALDKQLRAETLLGQASTDAAGQYAIRYPRVWPPNLVVRAYDAANRPIAESRPRFAAPADVAIDLTTAKDAVVRAPSTFTLLRSRIAAPLGGTDLADLVESGTTHELRFLADAAGASFRDVARLYVAHKLGAPERLRDETLFGILARGLPASLDQVIDALPASGIDAAFLAQILGDVLAHDRGTLSRALASALAANVVPASYAAAVDVELGRLDALRRQSASRAPYTRDGAPLADILAASGLASGVKAAFVASYADSGGRLDLVWDALRAAGSVSDADLGKLADTLDAAASVRGSLPLVRSTLARLSDGSLPSVKHLARLGQADWVTLIKQVDPGAASLPRGLPGDTVEQRIAGFAGTLEDRLATQYPTMSFAGGLARATETPLTTRREMLAVLDAHPDLELTQMNVDAYVRANRVSVSPAALGELKLSQRLLRVSPRYEAVDALLRANHRSAQSVYFKGRSAFRNQMSGPLGGPEAADDAFANAEAVFASSLTAFGRSHASMNRVSWRAFPDSTPSASQLDGFPDLASLFGSLDYCECPDCRSVLSPAAYLVDQLQFLRTVEAQDALLARRPDLQYVALSCHNTNITVPYIDLVNEILESSIAPPLSPVTCVDTTGTSAERRAMPQAVPGGDPGAYDLTAKATFPLSLPFERPFAETAAYLGGLGTSMAAIMALLQGAGGSSEGALAGASLGISPAMRAVITAQPTSSPWEPWKRWGLEEKGNPVDEPSDPTQHLAIPWDQVLGYVSILLQRSGLSLRELYQLFEVGWVTGGGTVTVKPGVDPQGVVSCRTEDMTLTGATVEILDRAGRFLRLWRLTCLPMWELDWALGQVPKAASSDGLDDAFVAFLARALTLRTRLGMPLPEILGLWASLQAVDVTTHLGEQDVILPSAYASVFRSPALVAAWGEVFVADARAFPASGQLTVERALQASTAALGISASDIQAVLATLPGSPAANALSLPVLSALFRHARLATALSLSVPDLILWIALAETSPWTGPEATLELLRRLDLLLGTGLSAVDLDYLLRHRSEEKSTLAFTAAQASTAFDALRAALAGLPAPPAGTTADEIEARTASVLAQTIATATGASAAVIAAVVDRLGVLPLPLSDLLATSAGGGYAHGAADFPKLTPVFVTVAKASALFAALRPTEADLAFLVKHAPDFGWLDVQALAAAADAGHFTSFERMLQALRLQRRRRARTSRLFDVLGGWLAAPPASGAAAIEALAPALDAVVDDVRAISVALGALVFDAATPPVLQEKPAGALRDVQALGKIADALDLVARYGVSGATLAALGVAAPVADTAAAARATFQAQHDQRRWLEVIQPIEDALRLKRRDALVAFLLAPAKKGLLSVDDLFGHFLIDPEMGAGAVTTRLLQASLTIQQFVQRCYLGLEHPITVDTGTHSEWNEWSWRSQFRVWQANREVFLYPENYLLPELRRDKSHFFSDLENDIRQGAVDADAVEGALETYLRKLAEVSKLVVAGHCLETRPDGPPTVRILHVLAHTRGTPPRWYYRQQVTTGDGPGIWSAWEPVNLDIASDHVLPVIWDRRLHLVWAQFKAQAVQVGEQGDPTGSKAPPPNQFWAIEFALSERRGGKWLPKRTLAEKMFFGSLAPRVAPLPLDFTLRAQEDLASNLQIQLYLNFSPVVLIGPLGAASANLVGGYQTSFLHAKSVLATPDDPLRVTSSTFWLPTPEEIDASREPSYALVEGVTPADISAEPGASIAHPNGYRAAGQDLVFVYEGSGSAVGAPVPLDVLTAAGDGGMVDVNLLGSIESPHLIVPQEDPGFSLGGPFFVSDVSRVFHVERRTITPLPGPKLAGAPRQPRGPRPHTVYVFSPFYHPFARTFLRELEIGGVDGLMRRDLQVSPQAAPGAAPFDFASYVPNTRLVAANQYPHEDVAFTVTSAQSLYNWELFYHAPMFMASLLMDNHRYADAMRWLGYVFDPTDSSSEDAPGRYWRTRPLHEMFQSDWLAQQIDQILDGLAAGDADDAAAIHDWLANPFDPHRVARLRIGAYGKATVMKFLDNLIAWGDARFSQDTMESVNQAEQLYILASMLLGPAPERVRLPRDFQPSNVDTATYFSIRSDLDGFSNVLVDIENVVAKPTPGPAQGSGGAPPPSLPQIAIGSGKTLFFCIPPNQTMLGYWDTVADRLGKIRSGRNLAGVLRRLALYAPPLDPLALIEGGGAGAGFQGLPEIPLVYRFATYAQKAAELAGDVRSLGALVLSALEKKDAEALAVLRSGQELDVITRMRDVKATQVTEASDQILALQRQKDVVQLRRDFYRDIKFMNAGEIIAASMQQAAIATNATAFVLDLTASVVYEIPQLTFGVAGFGGSPVATATWGGKQVGDGQGAAASFLRGLAGLLSEGGQMAATIGSYQRRADEWDLQRRTADAELLQLDAQLAAANERLSIATTDLAVHDRQIANAAQVDDTLRTKYTSGQLYDWMLSKLTAVHTQAYQLAVDLAQRANAAYNYELGTSESFIQSDRWDDQYQGLVAGEGLLFDLRRMEASYLAANTRELELTKHVSLALTQPAQLVTLRQTGTCGVDLSETLFDRDHPGHYFRRIRSVALTIACVTGPYTSVNATLTLGSNQYRVTESRGDGNLRPSGGGTQIATSSGQSDAGLFEVNLRDERWLPFEGQGAISSWMLDLRPEDNAFDLATVTDVVLHLRYTARAAVNPDKVRKEIKEDLGERAILVSARDTFADAYYRFFNPTDPAATEQTLALPLARALFPYSSLGTPQISAIVAYVVVSIDPGTDLKLSATFGAASPAAVSFSRGPGASPTWTLEGSLLPEGSKAVPGSFTLTLPVVNVPANLREKGSGRLDPATVQDILLVIKYTIP